MASKSPKLKKKPKAAKKSVVFDIDRKAPSLKAAMRRNLMIFAHNKKSFALVVLVYGILYFVFIRVLTKVDLGSVTQSVKIIFGDGQENILTRMITVGSLFSGSTNFDTQTALLFAIIFFINSLAIIWVLRTIWAKKKVKVKEAYYQGMYPLIPFGLIIVYVFFQMLPFTITSLLFTTAINNGIASSLPEKIGIMGLLAFGILWSGYLIIGSIIALYAVTVPQITPFKALDTARQVLKGRRFEVLRQVLLFAIISGVVAMVPMLFIIWLIPKIAIVVVALFIILALPWFHTYLYGLYRDLLND